MLARLLAALIRWLPMALTAPALAQTGTITPTALR